MHTSARAPAIEAPMPVSTATASLTAPPVLISPLNLAMFSRISVVAVSVKEEATWQPAA